MRRKFLSVLLAASMVLTLVPATAWAEGETVKLTFAPAVENAELSEDDTVTIEASATEEQGAVPDGTKILWTTQGEEALKDATDATAENVKEYSNGIAYADLFPADEEPTAIADGGVTIHAVAVAEVDGNAKQVSVVTASPEYTQKATTEEPGGEEKKVETPTIIPDPKDAVEAGTEISISCGTEGAKIYYTTDGKEPTSSSTEYSDSKKPTAAGEAGNKFTVKAIAVKDGMTNSDVATAEYTIKEASVDPDPTPDEVGEVTVALTAPEKGAVPATTIEAAGDHGAGTIEWAGDLTEAGKFKGGVVYTATVTLAPAEGKAWADTVTVTVTGQTAKEPTVKDGNLTFTVEYAALDAAVLSSIAVTTLPTKVTYEVGDDFDPAGMVVTGTFDDGTTKELTTDEYELSNDKALTAGEQNVTIKSKDPLAVVSTTVKVTVNKIAAELEVKADAEPTVTGTVAYGAQNLSAVTFATQGTVVIKGANPEVTVTGTWAWKEGQKPAAAGEQKFIAAFTPEDSDTYEYAPLETEITVTVEKATPEFTVADQFVSTKNDPTIDRVVVPEKADGVNGAKVSGTFKWIKSENDTAELDANPFENKTSGDKVTIWWTFTPDASETNYVGDVLKGSVEITMTDKSVVTVQFPQDAVSVVYGETPAANVATVLLDNQPSEDIAVTYESGTPATATIDEATGVVTVVKVGTSVITAKVAAVAEQYEGATATYTLAVTARPITITADDKTMKAGEAEPAYTYTLGGTLAYEDRIGSVAMTVEGDKTEGTHAIKVGDVTFATGEATNYEITKVNGTLTVEAADTPAPGEGLTITPSSVSIASGKVNTAASATFKVSGGTPGYTVEKVNGPDWLNVSINGDTVTISGTRPATAQAAATLTVKITDSTAETPLVKTVAVAVGAVTKPSSGGGSSSGGSGGGGGGGSSSVTVPVSGDDKSVEVSAKVSGSTATIDKIEGLNKVLDGDVDTGVVEIDLTALKKDIDTVKLPAAALEDIAKAAADADNDVEGLAVKLDSGTVEFDADALEAIADQASGSTIELKLEKSNANGLNSSQKDAVKDMDIHGHFDLTLNGGKAITDFKGGRVSVKIPFTVPSGKEAANFVVIYVANDGSVEEMRTNCSGGYISFTTDHFSKYVIAYKAPEPVEPVEETPVAADCDGGSSCPAHKFTDVNTSLWYHKAVDYAINNSLMSGVGENTFSPNANLSRAMLAQILYNLAGRPAAAGASDFNDVAEGMWYTNAIAWAAENGVVSGLGNGKFGPNDNITREQLAVMLYRYAGSPAAGGSLDGFADAGKVSGYAQNGLVWATSNGVMSGKGGGMLDPQGLATRAEVAQMLYNYLNK